MNRLRSQHVSDSVRSDVNWQLALLLGSFALVRPLLSIVGVSDGRPWVPILTTIGITVLWISVVVQDNDQRPVPTLMLAGGAYGVFAIALSIVLQGGLPAPAFAIPSILLTNVVWGAIAGIVAAGIGRLGAD